MSLLKIITKIIEAHENVDNGSEIWNLYDKLHVFDVTSLRTLIKPKTIIKKPGFQHLFDGYYAALCFGGMPSRKISL